MESLDTAIAELKTSVASVPDVGVRKELEKTLKNLKRAREKMNPPTHLRSYYIIAIPFVIIFIMTGIYYFHKVFKKINH